MKSTQLRNLLQCAIFAAMICLLSPIASIGDIPFSMGLFAILLCGVILSWQYSFLSVIVFLLLGIVGLPVFAKAMSGIGVLLGPTGGYLYSYPLVAVIVSLLSRHNPLLKLPHIGDFAAAATACICGTLVCYTLGTLHFMLVYHATLDSALMLCVIPYLLFDGIKITVAVILGVIVRKILQKQGLLS